MHRTWGVLALASWLPACERSTSTGRDMESGSGRVHTVFIHDFAFVPARLVVAPGDTVIFKNLDPAPHSAVGWRWQTGNLATDASRRVVLNHVGEYRYHCGPHPSMLGILVVAADQG